MAPRTRKNWKNFEEARGWVHNLGISTFREWRQYVSTGRLPDKPDLPSLPDDIPKSPNIVYVKEFQGFDDWLGTDLTSNEKYLSEFFSEPKNHPGFFEAAEAVKELHCKSPAMYRKSVRNHKKRLRNKIAHGKAVNHSLEIIGLLPIYPERIYDEWTSWGDFLGLNNKETEALEWMASKIKELRSNHNYTVAELARIIGTSPRSLSRFEDGEILPPDDIQFKIMNLVYADAITKQEVEEQKKYIGDTNIIFLEETKNSKEILNAVKNMEIRFSYDLSEATDLIGMIKELIKFILDYKNTVVNKVESSKIDLQQYMLASELDLYEIIEKLAHHEGGHPYKEYDPQPYGIFIYDKGSIQVGRDFLPCVLIYIGPVEDDRVKKRGKHGKNIALDIKEFGIDPTMEKWDNIFQERIWWSCPDYGHEWHLPISVAPDAECPICTFWDNKKNQKTSLDNIKSDSTDQYWWRCQKSHGFKISPAEFQKVDGICPVCHLSSIK